MKLAAKLGIATASVALSLTAVGVNSAQAVFIGPYDVSNWTLTNTNANGSVNTDNAPVQIQLTTGADNGTATDGTTDYTITADTLGQVSFSWDYSTQDIDSSYDPFRFVLNSTTIPILNNVQSSGSGNFTATIAKGDLFGFQLVTDNSFGSGTVTISNFDFAPVPEPSSLPCMVLFVGALFVMKKKYSQLAK